MQASLHGALPMMAGQLPADKQAAEITITAGQQLI
jgi:hypothetical protein